MSLVFLNSFLFAEELLFWDDFEQDIPGQPPTNWSPYGFPPDTIGYIEIIEESESNNVLKIHPNSMAMIQNYDCQFQYTIQVKWKAPLDTIGYMAGIRIPHGITFYYGFWVGPGLYISDPIPTCLFVEHYSYDIQPGEWYYMKLNLQEGISSFKMWHCDEDEPDFMVSWVYGDITYGFSLFSLERDDLFDDVTIYGEIYDEFNFIVSEEHLFPGLRDNIGLGNDGEYIWFGGKRMYGTSPILYKYDPETEEIIDSLEVIDDFYVRGFTYTEDHLWVLGFQDSILCILQISPLSGEIMDTLICSNYPFYQHGVDGPTYDGEYFYYEYFDAIYKFDPQTNTLVDSFQIPGIRIKYFIYHEGNFYIQSFFNDLLFVLDADDGEITGIGHCDYPKGYWPVGITVLNDYYWIASANVWPADLEGELTFYITELVTNSIPVQIYTLFPKQIDIDNYPNPFNPTTTFRYGLPKPSDVTLTVYNLLGQKVATLVEKYQNAGYYVVQWDATDLASGIYFYQITAGNLTQTRKMLLLK